MLFLSEICTYNVDDTEARVLAYAAEWLVVVLRQYVAGLTALHKEYAIDLVALVVNILFRSGGTKGERRANPGDKGLPLVLKEPHLLSVLIIDVNTQLLLEL